MMYEELRAPVVKCRKVHKCVWCGEIIEKGSEAVNRVYVYDGFGYDHMHPECYDAVGRSDFYDDEGFDAWVNERGVPYLEPTP